MHLQNPPAFFPRRGRPQPGYKNRRQRFHHDRTCDSTVGIIVIGKVQRGMRTECVVHAQREPSVPIRRQHDFKRRVGIFMVPDGDSIPIHVTRVADPAKNYTARHAGLTLHIAHDPCPAPPTLETRQHFPARGDRDGKGFPKVPGRRILPTAGNKAPNPVYALHPADPMLGKQSHKMDKMEGFAAGSSAMTAKGIKIARPATTSEDTNGSFITNFHPGPD